MGKRLLVCLFLICVMMSGCWDYKDLDKLSIVSGIAFDKAEDGQIKVTLEIIDRASQVKKEGLRSRSITVTARSADDAMREIAHQLDFELYFGNMAIALFGEDTPHKSLIEWLHGNREVRETVYLAAAKEAGELLDTKDGGVSAFALRDLLDASDELKPAELYRAGDTLPVFSLTENSGKKDEDNRESKEQKQPKLIGSKTLS